MDKYSVPGLSARYEKLNLKHVITLENDRYTYRIELLRLWVVRRIDITPRDWFVNSPRRLID